MTKITAMDRPKQALVVPTPLYIRICISKSCSYKFKFSDKTADETQNGKNTLKRRTKWQEIPKLRTLCRLD